MGNRPSLCRGSPVDTGEAWGYRASTVADFSHRPQGTAMASPKLMVLSLLLLLLAQSGQLSLAQQTTSTLSLPQMSVSPEAMREVGKVAVGASQSLLPASQQDASRAEDQFQPPNDPCLPALYTDWREFSRDYPEDTQRTPWSHVRTIIDRSAFTLVLEGLRGGDSFEEIYRTTVALGDVDSPTPEGDFWINHVYAYPDVVFFHASSQQAIAGLYNGFFAPLLTCDERGRCQRHNDLGLHGFYPRASPQTASMRPDTYGAVSGGCIRLPDPCAFKSALIRSVGVGPVRRNDRGSYHWLSKPVPVAIIGYYPGTEPPTLVSIFEEGLHQVQEGLKNLWDGFAQ